MKIFKKINKICSFLKEKDLLVFIKTKLLKILEIHKEEIKLRLEFYLENKLLERKDFLLDFIFSNIELGFPMKLFKKRIKKIASKNFDKIIKFLQEKLKDL